jgi:hypothetical protein
LRQTCLIGGRQISRSVVAAFVILWFATEVLAQERQVLPFAQQSPVQSRVDVSTLPPAGAAGPTGVEVKPFRGRDPQELERWKELIRRSPDAVPPAPGFVPDKRSDR